MITTKKSKCLKATDMCSVITLCGIVRRGGIRNEDIRRELKVANIVEENEKKEKRSCLYVPPKRQHNFTRVCSFTSQKVLFVIAASRQNFRADNDTWNS
jgi:hypothetical protein